MAVRQRRAQQIELDIDALERAAARTFNPDEREEVRVAQRRAYRWTFLVLAAFSFVFLVATWGVLVRSTRSFDR